MPDDETNPFAGTPPEWVLLLDIPDLLKERFGLPARQSADSLRGLLQDGRIMCRVSRLKHSDLRRGDYGGVVDPPGLVWLSSAGCVGVDDWSQACVDWLTGTVHGRYSPDGTRARHPIELRWREVEKIAGMWQSQMPHLKIRESIKGPNIASRKTAGGASTKHDWDAFWIEIALHASKSDLFAVSRTELQQHMVQWTAENMRDPAPDPATIRQKLKVLYQKVDAARNARN